QLVRLLLEDLAVGLARRRRVRERAAPHLRPVVLRVVLEELDEALEQVALREEQVDGEDDLELRGELVDPVADVLRVRLELLLVGAQEVGDADGDHRAVDRLLLPRLLEQAEEADPLLAVVDLRRVAAGGVEEDALVGEPPVAVARAADAADALLALARVGEVEARLLEGRGLARAGRPDDHVPWQLVERALAQARRLERLDRLV